MSNDVYLKIILDGQREVVNGINGVNDALGRTGDASRRAIADLAHIGGAFAVFSQAASGIASATRALDEFTTAASRLNLVASSAASAAEAQAQLFKIAQESRVSYTGLADTYAKLARSGNELGVSQDRMLAVTRSISQAMTISGGSAESMKAALLQLSQGFASGTLRGEELNSVMEQAPRLAQAIAEGMGKSVGELRKLGEEGKLTAESVLSALEKSAPKVAAEFQKMTPTVSQSLQVLHDGATKAFYEFDKGAGTSAALAKSINELGRGLGEAGAAAKEFGEKYGGAIRAVGEIAGLVAAAGAVGKLAGGVAALARYAANPITITIGLSVLGKKAFDEFVSSETGIKASLARAEAELSNLQSRAQMSGSSAKFDADIARKKQEIAALKASLDQISKGADIAGNLNAARDAAEKEAEDFETARTARRRRIFDTYMDEVKSEKEKQVAKENERFKAITREFEVGSKEYEAALAAHRKKLAEINKPAAGEGNDAAQSFAAQLKAAQDYSKTAVEIIQEKVRQQVISEREGIDQTLAAQQQGFVEQAKLLKARMADVSDKGELEKLRTQIVTLGNDAAVAAEKAASGIAKIAAETEKSHAKALKALQDDAASLEEKARAAEQENDLIGKSADELARLTEARYNERIALLESKRDAVEALAGRGDETEAIERQIDALKRLRDAEMARPKLREQAREWEKFCDDINRSLTDALYRSFESGGSFAQNFAKNLQNTLKAALAKALINVAITTGSNVLNSGINAVLGTSGSNGGAGVNYLGLAGNASSIYNLANGTYAGYWGAAQIGTGLTAAEANAAAAAYMDAGYYGTAASLKAGSLYGQLTGSGAAASGAASGSAAASGTAAEGVAAAVSAAAAGWGSAMATAGAYAAAAYVGWQIGTWLGGQMFGGKVSSRGSGTQGTLTDGGYRDLLNYQDMHKSGGWLKSGKSWTNTYTPSQEQNSAFLYASQHIGDPYKSLDRAAGGNLSSIYERGADWSFSFRRAINSAEDFKALMLEASESLGQKVAPELEKFRKEGEKLYDTAVRMQDTVAATNVLANVLGKDLKAAFGSVGLASLDVRQAVVDAAGGMESFQNKVGYFYENYRTDAEKTFDNLNQMRIGFASVGQSIPGSIEAFRDLVKAQDLTTASGRYAFAGLMNLAEGFKAFSESTAASNKAIESLRTSMSSDAQNLYALMNSVSAAFVKMGLAMPTSKQGFMALVDSLDSTTLSGIKARQALLDVSDSFIQLYEAKASIDSQIESLRTSMSSDAQNLYALMNSVSAAFVKMGLAMPTSKQGFMALIDSLDSTTLTGIKTRQSLLDVSDSFSMLIDKLAESSAQLASTGSSISSFIARLRSDTLPNSAIGAKQAYLADLAAAKSGDVAASSRITNSAAAYAETLRNSASNKTQLDISLSRMANELSALPATKAYSDGGAAQTVIASSIGTKNEEVKIATSISAKNNQLEELVLSQKSEIKKAQSLIDQANALEKSVYAPDNSTSLTIDSNGKFAGTVVSKSAKNNFLQNLIYGTFIDEFYKSGGLYDQIITEGKTLSNLSTNIDSVRKSITDMGGVPAFASGGDHLGGLRLVGERGPELEVTGPSRIFNADQTRRILSGGGQDTAAPASSADPALLTAIVTELRGLRQENAELRREMSQLRHENNTGNNQILAQSQKTARTLEKFDTVGLTTVPA